MDTFTRVAGYPAKIQGFPFQEGGQVLGDKEPFWFDSLTCYFLPGAQSAEPLLFLGPVACV